MIGNIGFPEIMIILVIVLLLFGAIATRRRKSDGPMRRAR